MSGFWFMNRIMNSRYSSLLSFFSPSSLFSVCCWSVLIRPASNNDECLIMALEFHLRFPLEWFRSRIPSASTGRISTASGSSAALKTGIPRPVRKADGTASKSLIPVAGSSVGRKLRTANASALPVLCVYSERNELLRQEKFRLPDKKTTTVTCSPSSKNSENLSRVKGLKKAPARNSASFLEKFIWIKLLIHRSCRIWFKSDV